MTSSNIFDIKDWRDREIPFSDGSVWRISGKVSEHVIKRTAQDVVELGKTPSMHVAFTCYDSQTPGRHGILKIDLQYPITDTELRPLRVRRQQASSDIDRSSMEELEVLRRLTDAHCPSAPRLLAHDRRVQDDDDAIVPGGWALYRVITAPRGICLGSGIRSTLHGRDVVEGEFWRLPRGARDQIRSQLESAYEAAGHVDVGLDATLQYLYWDNNRLRIDSGYFLCRPERNPAVPWSAMDFGYFGLAQIPEALLDVDMGEGVTIQELEDAGWVF